VVLYTSFGGCVMVRGLEAGAGHDVAFSTCDCPTAQHSHSKSRHWIECWKLYLTLTCAWYTCRSC